MKSCLEKQDQVIQLFANCSSKEQNYQKILELGRNRTPLDPRYKTEAYLVIGCQSRMYLHAYLNAKGALLFEAESEALISSGLAELLIRVYSGEKPETILKCPPTFLEDLDILNSLSSGRANGLYSLHLKMKQEALKSLVS